jgi:hypothetical protein
MVIVYLVGCAERRECSGEDYETGEKDPCEEAGEDVVKTRDGVQCQEHVHVARLDAVLAGWCSWTLSWSLGRGWVGMVEG